MTISNTTRTAGPFTGNNVTLSFPFYFKVFTAADVLVVRTDTTTGISTNLVMGVDYTVSLNPDQNGSPGGGVDMTTPLGTLQKLVLTTDLPFLQPVDLTNAGGFFPQVINSALDRLTIFCQQLAAKLARTLTLPISDTGVSAVLPSATARAGKLFGFDATGAPIAVIPTSGQVQLLTGVVVSVFDFMTPAQIIAVVGRDGVTDVSGAISAAILSINQRGGTLFFPPGTYVIPARFTFNNISNVRFLGAGVGATILKSTVPAGTPENGGPQMYFFISPKNLEFEGLTFDLNNILTTQINTFALGFAFGSDVLINHCEFLNGYRIGVLYNGTSRVRITNNLFVKAGAATGAYQNEAVLGTIATCTSIYIADNVMNGWGILVSGKDLIVDANIISSWGYGGGITINADSFTANPHVTNNVLKDSIGIDVNNTTPSGIECWAPYSVIEGNYCYDNSGPGISSGGRYSVVSNNVCVNNGNYNNAGSGIAIVGQTGYPTPDNTIVCNNVLADTGTGYQKYGYSEVANSSTPFGNIRVFNNNCSGNVTAAYNFSVFSTSTSFTGYCFEARASYDPPSIPVGGSNNTLQMTVGGAQVGDFVEVSCSSSLLGVTLSGEVFNANLVRVVLSNNTSTAIDIGTSFFYARVHERRPNAT